MQLIIPTTKMIKEIPYPVVLSSMPTDLAYALSKNKSYGKNQYYIEKEGIQNHAFVLESEETRKVKPFSEELMKEAFVRVALMMNEEEAASFEEGRIFYGEYPQTLVDRFLANKLTKLVEEGSLSKTGRLFTLNEYRAGSRKYEYEYEGCTYIRMRLEQDKYLHKTFYHRGEMVWFQVEPISWYSYPKQGFLLSRDCLLGGIPYTMDPANRNLYSLLSSDESYVAHFLNAHLSQEIRVPRENIEEKNILPLEEPKQKTIEDRLTFIDERLKLLRGMYTESQDYFDLLLNEVECIQCELPKQYKKVK